MTNWEILCEANRAMESDDPRGAAEFFTDDFVYTGTLVRPMDRQRFIQMAIALKRGFPDLSYNLQLVQEISPNRIMATMAPTGTHTGTFSLPGMMPVPATGRMIAQPRQRVEFMIRDGRIAVAQMEHASEGGIKGLLESLGLETPNEILEKIFR